MVRFGSISSSFGLTMGILARLRLAKIRTMARPNSPDMPPKRTKKVRLGIKIGLFSTLLQVISFLQVKLASQKDNCKSCVNEFVEKFDRV